MGGASSVTVADRQTTIQVQQSTYGLPIPVLFGTNRIPGNLVWFANFKANAQTTRTGGKGLGGSSTNTTYTYTASAILALCEGPIASIGQVWKDTELTTLSALGLTLFTGSPTQAVWSFLSGYSNTTSWARDVGLGYANYGFTPSFVNQAINYSGTAYVAASSYDLGNAAQVPNHNFEATGFNAIGGGNLDAYPADVVQQVLTNQQFGIGFNTAWVDSLSTGAASYQTYTRALGLFVSPYYSQQRPGTDVLKEMAEATNSGIVWSGGKLKILPYGDTVITGNGVTYTPNVTPLFDLADDDFIDNGSDSPIQITRSSPADAYNRVAVEFRDRSNQYNKAVAYAEDQDAIEKYGLKIAPTITLDFICVASIAKQIAQLALQRYLYKRNTYEFELVGSYPMLEPMDIVTVTDTPQGMIRVPVRITQIEEKDSSFLVTAEDMQIGVAAAATYQYDSGVRWTSARDIAPANPNAPVIFELPADPSATGLSVGIAVGGQTSDLAYGGCNIWLSLDGFNYKREGTIWGSSRYGTLSAALAASARGIDTTNTMAVALASNGQMLSGSTADVTNGSTAIVCDGEYLAYQNATLTGTNAYNLTTLNRGLYGTTAGAHASGKTWVRVDDAIAQLPDLDLTLIGKTIYIKLTAFNIYGLQEQDLSTVPVYTYTITGNMKALESPVTLSLWSGVTGAGKPADYATRNEAGANLLESPLKMDSGFAGNAGAFREDTGASGPARDRYRLRLDNDSAFYWIQGTTRFPLITGEKLWLKAWMYPGPGSSGLCQFGIAVYDVNGTYITNVAGPEAPASSGPGWYSLEAAVTVPANAAFAQPYFIRFGGTNGGSFYLAEPIISRQQPAADITGANVAAAIAGQAATATNSDYSAVTGTKPPSNATNGAPSGTPVGSITANDVSTTINSGGGVATNQVATASIQANGVTTPTSAYTDGSTAIASFSWTTVQTVTLTTTGGPVQIMMAYVLTAGGGSLCRVRRNGTVIYSGTGAPVGSGYCFPIFDTPGAGSTTYTLEANGQTAGGVSVAQRSLIVTEFKR